MHRLVHRPDTQLAGPRLPYALFSAVEVRRIDLRTRGAAIVTDRRVGQAANTRERVDHQLVGPGRTQDRAFDQLDGELARMPGLLSVIVPDIGDDPDVAGVLALGINGVLAGPWAFEMLFPRGFLGVLGSGRYRSGTRWTV